MTIRFRFKEKRAGFTWEDAYAIVDNNNGTLTIKSNNSEQNEMIAKLSDFAAITIEVE